MDVPSAPVKTVQNSMVPFFPGATSGCSCSPASVSVFAASSVFCVVSVSVEDELPHPAKDTVIAAAITSQTGKARLPTHIDLSANTYGLPKDSVVLLEQIRTLDKKRLREYMGRLDEEQMQKVDGAIAVSFGLRPRQLV